MKSNFLTSKYVPYWEHSWVKLALIKLFFSEKYVNHVSHESFCVLTCATNTHAHLSRELDKSINKIHKILVLCLLYQSTSKISFKANICLSIFEFDAKLIVKCQQKPFHLVQNNLLQYLRQSAVQSYELIVFFTINFSSIKRWLTLMC